MISNITTLTKEDYYSTVKHRMKLTLPITILMLLAGGYILYMYVPHIYNMLCGNYIMSGKSTFLVYMFSIIAIIFICFGLFYTRIVALLAYRRGVESATRVYNFLENGIETISKSDKMEQKAVFKYESMTGYMEINDSVHIELDVANRKLYLLIHNDGYTEGSKDDAIKMLESKGIKKITG